MRKIYLIPELNYWMIIVLKNSPINDTYHKIPTVISDYWTEPNSVLSLLFNENFSPNPPASSSSSSSSGNSRNYIWQYRTCNLLLIPDKNVLNRLQLYRWNSTVYAADSHKFMNIFDSTGTRYPPVQNNSDIIFDTGLDYLEASSETVPNLPVDVEEKDRSPYISYTTHTTVTTNYSLVKHGKQEMKPWPPVPPIPPTHNVFNLTEDDLMMLDKLYDYKVNGVCPDLTLIDFNNLHGCIAKLIYVYLDAFCFNQFTYFDSEEPIASEGDILCSLYEKCVLDMICQLKIRQYGVIWKNSDIINNQIIEENTYQFMIMKKENLRITITPEMIYNKELIIPNDNIPWDKRDVVLFKNGLILTADEDYMLVLDFSDPVNVIAKISFLKDIFIPGENIKIIYSYVEPETAFTEDQGLVVNNTFGNSSDSDNEGRIIQ